MKKCDIIIPIYNAYECLIDCIDSVIKNTDFDGNKLILIDDKSPDDRILKLIHKYEKKHDFIEVLENKENLGFVGTVNRGMKYSKNDVVLLNSDTEVTKDWLKKICKCAYSEKMIATVTPLSNNATHVSVPNGLKENDLPNNMSLEEYGSLIEKIAYNENVELPTAHGFCMFIKREVLNRIGYFDEETFGKGYGEENDFSFRCLEYGYRNILCDNVIIYHKEKQSFSTKREELIKKNLKKLHDRYPVYSRRIELWCEQFPIKKQCENIKVQTNLYNRKNILVLIHDWSDISNNVGGTTLHVKDLIFSLKDRYNFHVLAKESGGYKLTSYFKDEETVVNFPDVDSCNLFGFYNSKYKEMIKDIVEAYRIDTIHIHHMIGHFFDVIDVAKEKKLYSIITLHDFYCLCPTINMLYKMETYCPNLKNKNCKECLQYKTGIRNNIIDKWQENWNSFLKEFDIVITPSENTKKEIEKIYKNINIIPIEHGIDIPKNNYKINALNNENEFNVAFVGVMSVHKGGNILKALIKNTKNKRIKYHLFGTTEFKELEKNKKNYIFHGKYKREELPKLLKENNINLVCNFSIWAETYSYTLTEEIASGVPVLSFKIGAVGDRIEKNKFGWTINLNKSIDEIIEKIQSIVEDKNDYIKKLKNIYKYDIKTVKEMCKEYEKFYDTKKMIPLNDNNIKSLQKVLKNDYHNNMTLNQLETQWILNSLKWKLVSKIKVPNIIKKIIRRVVR